MKNIKMPSGNTVLDINTNKSEDIKSTSGTLKLEDYDVCPKCNNVMGTALSGSESVYYCDKCRVSSPMEVN